MLNRTRSIFLPVLLRFALLLILNAGMQSCKEAPSSDLKIASSANMQFAMRELIDAFESETGLKCEMIVSSSGKLTAQIRENAPFDVFVSADMKFPETLYALGKTHGKPQVYAYGKLVIWTAAADITPGFDALRTKRVAHIAMANPQTAPYGKAAETVLKKKALFDELQPKLVYGESISQTNRFILSGAADIGFTAQSVVFSPKAKGIGKWVAVPENLYNPIAQGVVVLNYRDEHLENALRFKTFLLSAKARQILKKFGYALP